MGRVEWLEGGLLLSSEELRCRAMHHALLHARIKCCLHV